MDQLPNISLAFLEENIGKKVESFIIRPGTKPGDNYMSIIYSIDVKLANEKSGNNEVMHLFAKCYPSHSTRQELLNKSNIFWNELSVYKVLIPELDTFSKKMNIHTKLPFPPLVGGKAINYEHLREIGDTSYIGQIYGPLENYIMMTDMRETLGFRMTDKQSGLDLDHMSLVIKTQAKLHALSWAFKKHHGLNSMSQQFPFLRNKITDEFNEIWMSIIEGSINLAAETIEAKLGKDSVLLIGTLRMKVYAQAIVHAAFNDQFNEDILTSSHRAKETNNKANEASWRVVLHGDCWTNNLLFCYDEHSLKPVDVMLVDLQMMRENCPTIELAFLLYSSTTSAFRRQHLNDVLALYYQEFANVCSHLKVESLPDFTLDELRRRFHRAKAFGFLVASMAIPMMLKNTKEAIEMETIDSNKLVDMFEDIYQLPAKNEVYIKRLLSTTQEFYDDGVI